MPYQMDGLIKVRELGHKPEFVVTVKLRSYTIDKYLCNCGAEVQIASTSKIGVWVSASALKPCEGSKTSIDRL